MKVRHLIAKLWSMDLESEVMVLGYETGMDKVVEVVAVEATPTHATASYDGAYKEGNGQDPVFPAVLLLGKDRL